MQERREKLVRKEINAKQTHAAWLSTLMRKSYTDRCALPPILLFCSTASHFGLFSLRVSQFLFFSSLLYFTSLSLSPSIYIHICILTSLFSTAPVDLSLSLTPPLFSLHPNCNSLSQSSMRSQRPIRPFGAVSTATILSAPSWLKSSDALFCTVTHTHTV